MSVYLWVGLTSLCLLLSGLLFFLKRYSWRWTFGVFIMLLFFLIGMGEMNRRLQQTGIIFPSGKRVYEVVVTQKPEVKERSLLCPVTLIEGCDSTSGTALSRKNLLLYILKSKESISITSGSKLLVSVALLAPVNNGNPDEFDYKRYLYHKNISGIGFVSPDNWKILSQTASLSLKQKAVAYREKLLAFYQRLGFKGDEFAVLSALTVGYKEELSEDIRETYSVAGASHVLALSGLHIGFLFVLLFFCLNKIPGNTPVMNLFRAIVIIGILWSFAFFTGLSPSVVRSVIMFSLLALSGVFGRKGITLNTLAMTAFFMLLGCPQWLFDVGFQLSFSAVAAILLIQPWIYRKWTVRNRILKYIWGLVTVSFAAQVGTAPLVLFYFSSFPTYFFLTNLIVIPLVSVIIYAAVFMLVLTPFTTVQIVVASLVRGCIYVLNTSVRWIEGLPCASIDGVWVDGIEVIGFYLFCFLIICYSISKRGKVLVASCLCFSVLMGYHLLTTLYSRPEKSIIFYNIKSCPAVHCIVPDGRSWLACADSVPDVSPLRRVASRYWRHIGLETPEVLANDRLGRQITYCNHLLSFAGKRIGIINDNRWRNKTSSQPLFIDYLYIGKGYKGRLEELKSLFSFRKVILDASVSEYKKATFKEECQPWGVELISLSDEGSVRFLL